MAGIDGGAWVACQIGSWGRYFLGRIGLPAQSVGQKDHSLSLVGSLPCVEAAGARRSGPRAWLVVRVESRAGSPLRLERLRPRNQTHCAPSHRRTHCRVVFPRILHGRVDMGVARGPAGAVPAAGLGAADSSLHAAQTAAYVGYPLEALAAVVLENPSPVPCTHRPR